MMLGDSGGTIQAFDQDVWATEGRYQDVTSRSRWRPSRRSGSSTLPSTSA